MLGVMVSGAGEGELLRTTCSFFLLVVLAAAYSEKCVVQIRNSSVIGTA